VGATVRVIRVFDASEIGTPALMTGPSWVAIHTDIESTQREQLERRVAKQPSDVAVEPVFCLGSRTASWRRSPRRSTS
jgi:hypothetical protein